jgi:Putative phage metallopeptidase
MIKNIFLVCAFAIASCKKQNGFSPVYDVPPEFQSYVTSFVNEAATRGHNYTINNLVIQYDSSLTDAYCATSNIITAENNVQKIISINPRLHCGVNDQEMEALIFHELGHCFLGRDHDNNVLPNGDPKSLMKENDISLYSPCIYNLGDPSCDKRYRRTYYLDELFNAATPVPDWGK